MARSRTRVSETVYFGPFKIGGSAGRSGARGWGGVRIGRTWLDVSRWFGAPVSRAQRGRKSR